MGFVYKQRVKMSSLSPFLFIFILLSPLVLCKDEKQCIDSKLASHCESDKDCQKYSELHLYCNKTQDANVCAFRIESYAGQAEEGKDCPGEEFSAAPWSNPISDDVMEGGTGTDCMRWCFNTPTCFAAVVANGKCYLRNDKCFVNLKPSKGAILGVMSVLREDYRCGCHYPFTRHMANGQILSWSTHCPESELDKNPYRCCSPKGLCIKCQPGQEPTTPTADIRY